MVKYGLVFMIVCGMVTSCTNRVTGLPVTIPTNTPSLVTSFPQLINTPTVFLEALIAGELILENGCLRVKEADGNSVLLIWRPGFSVREDQGIVQVIDSEGQVAASVGDFVEVGGGFAGNPASRGLVKPLPEDCPGSYWLVGKRIRKIDRP